MPHRPARHLAAATALACLVTLCATLPLRAQDVVVAPPENPVLAPHLRKLAPPPSLSRPPASTASPFKAGSIVFSPRLSLRYLNAEGLPAADGRRVASEIRAFSPGLLIDLGENWSFDYSPSWTAYTARAMADSTDHSARLSGGLVWQDWSFSFGQSFIESNPTLVETGRQTDQKTWATTLGSVYRHNTKLQLELSGSLDERYTSIAPDLKTWAGRVFVNYLLTPQVSLNVGPGFSYTEVAHEPDYYGESVMARINWRPGDKLTLGIGGGVEYTHSNSANGVDLSNPLLDISINYSPFEFTTLGASVARTVSASYFQTQATENLRWSLNLNQRLLGKIYLGASYSRQENDYMALQGSVVAGRADKVGTYNLRLSTNLLQRLSVSLVWQENRNRSNLAIFSFTSRQYGLELAYRY